MESATEEDLKSLNGIIYGILDARRNQWYIGSTLRSFRKRYRTKNNWWRYSHNDYLIRNIEKYGIENFRIFIIESGIKNQEELDTKEIRCIEQYKSLHPSGYNFDTGGSGGRVWSEASKLKKSKTYVIKHRDGSILTITNGNRFCRENKINLGDFGRMIKGQQIFAGDYCLPDTDPRTVRLNMKPVKVKDDEGNVYDVYSRIQFAREHRLNSSSFSAMCLGRNKRCKQFSLLKTDRYFEGSNKTWLKMTLIKDGREYEVFNAERFARKNGFNPSALSGLISGKTFSIKGFKLKHVVFKTGETKEFDTDPHLAKNRKFADIVVELRDGRIVKVESIKDFCFNIGINPSSFSDALNGQIKSPRKYRIVQAVLNPNYCPYVTQRMIDTPSQGS